MGEKCAEQARAASCFVKRHALRGSERKSGARGGVDDTLRWCEEVVSVAKAAHGSATRVKAERNGVH